MFIFYRENIINIDELKNVHYYEAATSMRFEYSDTYNIIVKCPKKEAETDLQKIFEMLKKGA